MCTAVAVLEYTTYYRTEVHGRTSTAVRPYMVYYSLLLERGTQVPVKLYGRTRYLSTAVLNLAHAPLSERSVYMY